MTIAPDSDAAIDARRKLLDVIRPKPGAAEPSRRDQAIELLRAIAEASAERADVVAWADELRRAERPEARWAIELAQAMGHTLDVHQTAYLQTHKAGAALASDAPYRGALTADEVARFLVDPEEAGLAPVACVLAEAIALLVPNPDETLERVGAAGARRVSAVMAHGTTDDEYASVVMTGAKRPQQSPHLAAIEMAPRITAALGTGATVLYARDAAGTPDVQVVAAGTPLIVIGPRLRAMDAPMPPVGELRFLLGRAAALAQPQRLIFAGAPREDAGRLLAAVIRSFGPPGLAQVATRLLGETDHAEDVQRMHDEHVRTTLPVRLRGQLQQILAQASPRALDLDAFLAAADRTADRAGLLASDDPVTAFAAVRARGVDATHLVRAALSPGWLALRAKLGWK